MRIRLLFVLLILSTLAVAADPAADKAALLKLHAQDRDGHLQGNADLIAAPLAANFTEVVGGHVKPMTREEAKQQFLQYLKTVKFTMWDDASEPVIKISSDGQMAWMFVETKAEVAAVEHPDEKRSFMNASIQTYEKGPDGWKMTAIAASAGK